MRLLLCLPSAYDFGTTLDYLNEHGTMPIPFRTVGDLYLFSTRFLQHDIDVAFIGKPLFEVSFKTTKAIQSKYHLALKVDFCRSLKTDIEMGTVVNVIKEKPIYINEFGENLYKSKMLNAEDYPHFKGSFINMNNSYMNIFMDFKKVVSGTMDAVMSTNAATIIQELYSLDTFTENGIGFVYPCMFERQPFYQINVVNSNAITKESNHEKARTVINETLIDILQKI